MEENKLKTLIDNLKLSEKAQHVFNIVLEHGTLVIDYYDVWKKEKNEEKIFKRITEIRTELNTLIS